MKTLFASLAVAALVVPGAAYASAQPAHSNGNAHNNAPGQSNGNNRYNENRSDRSLEVQAYKFKRGDRFDRSRAEYYRRLNYADYSRLTRPPRGYVWVRSGNDALMVRLADNIVTNVIDSLF